MKLLINGSLWSNLGSVSTMFNSHIEVRLNSSDTTALTIDSDIQNLSCVDGSGEASSWIVVHRPEHAVMEAASATDHHSTSVGGPGGMSAANDDAQMSVSTIARSSDSATTEMRLAEGIVATDETSSCLHSPILSTCAPAGTVGTEEAVSDSSPSTVRPSANKGDTAWPTGTGKKKTLMGKALEKLKGQSNSKEHKEAQHKTKKVKFWKSKKKSQQAYENPADEDEEQADEETVLMETDSTETELMEQAEEKTVPMETDLMEADAMEKNVKLQGVTHELSRDPGSELQQKMGVSGHDKMPQARTERKENEVSKKASKNDTGMNLRKPTANQSITGNEKPDNVKRKKQKDDSQKQEVAIADMTNVECGRDGQKRASKSPETDASTQRLEMKVTKQVSARINFLRSALI
jgi:hypothetical protein